MAKAKRGSDIICIRIPPLMLAALRAELEERNASGKMPPMSLSRLILEKAFSNAHPVDQSGKSRRSKATSTKHRKSK